MKNKVIKQFLYEGLGFPIVLKNLPTIEKHGEVIPDVNFNQLQKAVLLSLCHKAMPLTGNEIGFIRKYFEMTLAQFGEKLGCSHVAVLKWEKQGDTFAKIEPTTDVCIRLFVFSQLNSKSVAFKQLYNELNIAHLLKCKNQAIQKSISIDVKEELKAAS